MGFSGQENSTEGINEINVTPFVDVVLVLLVIFMVTAPLISQQILEVKLPTSASSSEMPPETLGVAITHTGQILLAGELVSTASLVKMAREKYQQNPQVQVVIAADKEVKHEFVIKAIGLLKKVGIENLAFQVEASEVALED